MYTYTRSLIYNLKLYRYLGMITFRKSKSVLMNSFMLAKLYFLHSLSDCILKFLRVLRRYTHKKVLEFLKQIHVMVEYA